MLYALLNLLEQLLELYTWVLLIRILLTWLQLNWRDKPFCWLAAATDPVLEPFRRLIPPLGGMLDLSPLVVFLLLGMLKAMVANFKFALLG
jgi:YggT family protein